MQSPAKRVWRNGAPLCATVGVDRPTNVPCQPRAERSGARRLVGSRDGAWDESPGFHPLPPRTVREPFGKLRTWFALIRLSTAFLLRAAALPPFLRGIHRFSTSGHPDALDACYVASCQLPRPDFHRLGVDSFQGTPTRY
jgi:hypothetical protein